LSEETYTRPKLKRRYATWVLPCLAGPLGFLAGFRSYSALPTQWGIFVPLVPFLFALLLSLVAERVRASRIRTAWGPNISGLILNGEIALGMTTSQVEEAWGPPTKREMLLISGEEGTLKFMYRGQQPKRRQLWFKDDKLFRVDS